jgi:hypothetical protein
LLYRRPCLLEGFSDDKLRAWSGFADSGDCMELHAEASQW